jgi:hypothetical protein
MSELSIELFSMERPAKAIGRIFPELTLSIKADLLVVSAFSAIGLAGSLACQLAFSLPDQVAASILSIG